MIIFGLVILSIIMFILLGMSLSFAFGSDIPGRNFVPKRARAKRKALEER